MRSCTASTSTVAFIFSFFFSQTTPETKTSKSWDWHKSATAAERFLRCFVDPHRPFCWNISICVCRRSLCYLTWKPASTRKFSRRSHSCLLRFRKFRCHCSISRALSASTLNSNPILLAVCVCVAALVCLSCFDCYLNFKQRKNHKKSWFPPN